MSRQRGPQTPAHSSRCIGCPLIQVPYPQQLAQKRAVVEHALAQFSSLGAATAAPVIPSPQRLGYRTRVKLVVRRNREEIALGLYVPGSHRVMDISSCPVHPRAVNLVSQYLKKKILELEITPYDERDDSGDLRYVDFRYSMARRELSITLVTRHAAFAQGTRLARALMHRFSFVTGVLQNINESRGNVIWGAQYKTLAGRDALMERFGDLKLVFSPGVFSQANPFTARKIYEYVYNLAALRGEETVLDLYCGVGPISLSLARAAQQIWAIDESKAAIVDAKQNARRNGRGNCRFISGDVAAEVVSLRNHLRCVDLAVLNPPRKGLSSEARSQLIAVNAARLIYVSCDPRSLSRDLDRLISAGYHVSSLQPFDMFPQTEEVETVALLLK